MPNRARFMHASSLRRQTVVRRGRRTGSDVRVASFESSVDGPPASPRDYATLSAGWGAALATLLLAARDKGEEPVRPAEVVPLGGGGAPGAGDFRAPKPRRKGEGRKVGAGAVRRGGRRRRAAAEGPR